MEAPEKIYINPLPNPSDGYVGIAWDEPHKTMVEYIRKDAFIEKACDWLINHNDYICGSTNGIVKYDMKQLVEDFEEYMEKLL